MRKPFVTSASVIAILRDTLGEISNLVPVVGGEESHAFGFQTAGEDYIVRVNRSAEGFEGRVCPS
jgi:hypothetical protein